MKIKVTKLSPTAKMPKRVEGTNVYTIFADGEYRMIGQTIFPNEIETGLRMEIPKGYVAVLKGIYEGIDQEDFVRACYNVHTEFFMGGTLLVHIYNPFRTGCIDIKDGEPIARLVIQKIEDIDFEE